MKKIENIYGDDKIFDACGLFGVMDTGGRRFGSQDAIAAIANMRERGNGLGGGFAIYGLYPYYADYYAFHAMCVDRAALSRLKDFLEGRFGLVHEEEIPAAALRASPTPLSCGATSCTSTRTSCRAEKANRITSCAR